MFLRTLGEAKIATAGSSMPTVLWRTTTTSRMETPEPNIGRDAVDEQHVLPPVQPRHGRIGHLFQRRYDPSNAEDPVHQMEVVRYIPLNPVRGTCAAGQRTDPWSSHRAMLGVGRREKFSVHLADASNVRPRSRPGAHSISRMGRSRSRNEPQGRAVDATYRADSPRPPRDRASILQAREDGHSLAEIARHLGVTPPRFALSRRNPLTVTQPALRRRPAPLESRPQTPCARSPDHLWPWTAGSWSRGRTPRTPRRHANGVRNPCIYGVKVSLSPSTTSGGQRP